MKIFKLIPRNLENIDWQSSIIKDPVVVRAPSEKVARLAATMAFRIATDVHPGKPLAMNPWEREVMVEATVMGAAEIEKAGWPVDGPVEILDPPGHNGPIEQANWNEI